MDESLFSVFEKRMRMHSAHDLAIRAFRHYYAEHARGKTGFIREDAILPASGLQSSDSLDKNYAEAGTRALSRVGILKLNGGLGTTMGLAKAKSMLRAKGDHTFLDLIVHQTAALRRRFGTPIPLLFMNSFATHDDTLDALKSHPEMDALCFVQNRIPKVLVDGGTPAGDAGDAQSWCPPGHGDLYVALQTSGALQKIHESGTEFLFVSNSDNLGAVVDPAILGYMATKGCPFLMEVADRTEADKKGGHLAQTRDSGSLLLRELAQCTPEDESEFQNVEKYRYFNTNSIWLHVPTLIQVLNAHEGVLPLSLIRNKKPLNPRDANSPLTYQLETAMGSAISQFEKAEAIRVPRSRFAPVKTCSDLLVLWSDAYVLEDDFTLSLHPQCEGRVPIVSLDKKYGFVDQLERRFPNGPPSLKGCRSLSITGDIEISGDLSITAGT